MLCFSRSPTLSSHFPVQSLQFGDTFYEGTIADNTLTLSQITLTQGYENGYEVSISGRK